MTAEWVRTIAHADMDAFYASVEQLDDPSLRGQAMVVGPKSRRGVVLTASYEARKYGIRSAMPMADALRRCPDILVVPPRFERYQQQSQAIMAAFANFSPLVQAISLDEAFIDMTGASRLFGSPVDIANKIRRAVVEATGGLTASVGVSATRYVAKVASDHNKPDGITVVPPEQAVDWLDPMPVSRLWGAGPKTVPRIERLGLYTIGDVRRADPLWLRQKLGRSAAHFQALARAEDPRPVERRRVARSMSSDRTLLNDVTGHEEIKPFLRRSADRIGRRLRDKGYRCRGVRLKLKTTKFELLTRQEQLSDSTDSADLIYKVGIRLLKHFSNTQPFRLVGLAAYDLVREGDPLQLDLFADGNNGSAQSLERTVDRLVDKFGSDVLSRAGDLGRSNTIAGSTPTLDFIDGEE